MMRISVCSWNILDASTSTSWGMHSHTFHGSPQQAASDGRYPRISELMTDKLPKSPSDKHPQQRLIRPARTSRLSRSQLRLMANGVIKGEELYTESIYSTKSQERVFYQQQQNRISAGMGYQLQLVDFRPLIAPFVPDLVRLLVLLTEADCKEQSWNALCETSHTKQTRKVVQKLVANWSDEAALKRLIDQMTLPLKVSALRAFLGSFPMKLLHFDKETLQNLTKRPLYDQFLRPNRDIRRLVRNAAIPNARTTLDTLAFVMLHLLHAWEHVTPTIQARSKLVDIYGPLLISFSESPVLVDRDMSSISGKYETAYLIHYA